MRERRTAGGKLRPSNKRTLTNRLLFYKRKKGLSRGYFSRMMGWCLIELVAGGWGLMVGNSIWFETAQFSIGNFREMQYPPFGAVERGAVGSFAFLSCVSIQEMYLEEYSTYTKCIRRYNVSKNCTKYAFCIKKAFDNKEQQRDNTIISNRGDSITTLF